MESYPVIEFEGVVAENGSIAIPRQVLEKLKPGDAVTVRITDGVVSQSLRSRGVSEDEIERIARLQLETRTDVMRCLLAEGALAKNRDFARRAKVALKA